MIVAQQLYEGIDIGEEKPVGLITYMRTDSTAISPEAQAAARQMISDTLGAKYLPEAAPQYKTKVKNAQEAHEAIRPTDARRYPKTLQAHLSPRQFQVYDLIWRRFVASQMAAAIYSVTTVNVAATVEGQPPYLFRATGRDLVFDGFLRVWQEEEKSDDDDEPQTLPELTVNELLDLLALIPKQHFTQPPGRYTESALVKALEERGIGRPSTYAAILKTLKDREYVVLDKRMLSPTALGEATCDALIAAFPDVMDYQFTAQVEDWLDEVSRGEREWVTALTEFYTPFAQALQSASAKMAPFKGVKTDRPPVATSDRAQSKRGRRSKSRATKSQPAIDTAAPVCPQCSSPMVKRTGPRGKFWGCSTYPKCKGTRNL